jgi:hypothetical protein
MRTVISLCVVVAAIAVPAAAGDGGPSPGVDQVGEGVLSLSGKLRYVAVPTENETILEAIRVDGGLITRARVLRGHFGIPFVTNSGQTGGLSHYGNLLVLSDAVCCGLRTTSRFVVLDTKTLKIVYRIVLRGDFSYDALSPDGATLFMIQHTSARDFTRYRVRAYDLGAGRLLQRVIVDRREPNEVMRGYPVARVASANGIWAYTLYMGGEKPFIHALDTVRRNAVCLDLDWHGSQNRLWQLKFRLSGDGKKLLIATRKGRVVMAVDAPR